MELMQEVKGYSDSREEEEEEEAREESSSRLLHLQQDAASNFINIHKKQQQQLDFMDLSLGNNKDEEANFQGSGSGGGSSTTPTHTHGHATSSSASPTEKEHMFDKVVTPSDVGKLNRLVIPKQHAEKYFPLDSTSNEKGLLLNFEDRNGKLWRFRYSYWNSSQSYVMTKGWSRFVKEKKLDAGDIVSFQRGVGELYRHRLYIDWRRRPDHHGPADPTSALFTPLFLPNQPHLMSHYSVRWGGRLYSLPSSPSPSPVPPPRHREHFQHLNYSNMYPFHHQQQLHQQQQHAGGSGSHHYSYNNDLNSGSGSLYYLRSTPSVPMGHQSLTGQQQEGGNIAPMIIDSVPVAHHHHHGGMGGSSGSNSSSTVAAGKRLRLFGVNMECASSSPSSEEPKCCSLLSSASSVAHVTMTNSSLSPSSSSSLPPLDQRLRVPNGDPLSSSARFGGDHRGEASMLFDLDPSLQYRQ